MIALGLLCVLSLAPVKVTEHAKRATVTAQDMSQESHKISVNVDQASPLAN
jgi:histone H3/H4